MAKLSQAKTIVIGNCDNGLALQMTLANSNSRQRWFAVCLLVRKENKTKQEASCAFTAA